MEYFISQSKAVSGALSPNVLGDGTPFTCVPTVGQRAVLEILACDARMGIKMVAEPLTERHSMVSPEFHEVR